MQATAPARTRELKVLSWNVCAIAPPFRAPAFSLIAGLVLLGESWHDDKHDVPLDALGVPGKQRVTRWARYIATSGADVVLLQEISGLASLDALTEALRNLGEEYEASVVRSSPTPMAVAVLGALLAVLFALEFAVVTALFAMTPFLHARIIASIAAAATLCHAIKLRHSIPAQYLLGSISGQLAVLYKKGSIADRRMGCTCSTTDSPADAVGAMGSFEAFEALAPLGRRLESTGAPCWLKAFFRVRPRGVLRVRLPLTVGSRTGQLAVMNVHLPHCTDNAALLHKLADLTTEASSGAAVCLGGDFNPDPDVAIPAQFRALLDAGNQLTSETVGSPLNATATSADVAEAADVRAAARGGAPRVGMGVHTTWDLRQPLARLLPEAPFSLQMDFLFTRDQARCASTRRGDESRRLPPDSPVTVLDADWEGSRLKALPEAPLDLQESAPCRLVVEPEQRGWAAAVHEARGAAAASEQPTARHITADRGGVGAALIEGCRTQLELIRTEVVEKEAFFAPNAPLSDHYGLMSTFHVTLR